MECGGAQWFCPAGSAARHRVHLQHYTARELHDEGTEETGVNISRRSLYLFTTQSKEVLCDAGYSCHEGVRSPCPAGRFGSKLGNIDPQCEDDCEAG